MALVAQALEFAHPGAAPLFAAADIRIEAGAILGLTGPSGAGKSTLGALLAGELRATSGEILVDGAPAVRRGFRPVQRIHQHPESAVNPRWRMRAVLRESHAVTAETLERVGIQRAWLDRWPAELSGGELQRFCIARALHPETRYIIADEMTAMFDSITQARMWQLLTSIVRERRIGLLVISHEQALLDRICDEQIGIDAL